MGVFHEKRASAYWDWGAEAWLQRAGAVGGTAQGHVQISDGSLVRQPDSTKGQLCDMSHDQP
jgi:hypothetical protein